MKTPLRKLSGLAVLLAIIVAIPLFLNALRSQSGLNPNQGNIRPPVPPQAKKSQKIAADLLVPSPMPDRGVRINNAAEIVLEELNVGKGQHYSTPSIDGDILIVAASTEKFENSLMQIDLKSGKAAALTSPVERRLFNDVHLSGNFISWRDNVSATVPLGYENRLIVFDRNQRKEIVVRQGNIFRHDLKDDVLVWEEARNQTWGIYARDLRDGRDFTVVEGSIFRTFPRVCSRNWIVFLQNHVDQAFNDHVSEVELHARNLSTGENVNIGNVRYTYEATMGGWHLCDSQYVAWIPVGQSPAIQAHLYDLSQGQDKTLEMPTPVYGFASFKDGLLLGSAGYDVSLNVLFDFFPLADLPLDQRIGGWLVASRSKVVWLTSPYDGGVQQLYMADIVRSTLV